MNAIRTYQRHHQPAAVVAGLANLFPARIDGISLKEQGSGGNAPRLPAGLTGLAVTLRLQHNRLKVEITSTTKTYRILDGQPLPLLYYGQRLTVSAGDPVNALNQTPPTNPTPCQSRNRAPRPHRGAP